MSGRARGCALVGVAAAIGLAAPSARAERPVFAGGAEPLAHDGEHVRVHYVTTSDDATLPDDADDSGVPDFVEEVAVRADLAWDDLVARGFRMPLVDTGLVKGDDGGDERFDIYLRDLVAADGNFVAEACTKEPVHCAGYFTMENDLVDFNYASVAEGISVLTSHELFHAVQAAYVTDMELTWSEGTAVWNEEATFPEQSDYERLVESFLERPHRPFDRAGGGFTDLYAYGAALWATFLEERYGDGTVARAWEACEALGPGSDFLDAIDGMLAEDGESVQAAWTEFSRWNLFTAERADPSRAYQAGADLIPVATEEEVAGPGSAATTIEGLSARYLPVTLPADGEPLQITVEVDDGAVAAFLPEDDSGALGEAIELVREQGLLTAALPDAERGFLVLTGVRSGGLPREANIEIGVAPEPPEPDGDGDEDEGGCQAARSGGGGVPGSAAPLLAAAAFVLAMRRRARRRAYSQVEK
jgi:hypothetical protein